MTAQRPTVHRILVIEDHPVVRAGLREMIDAEPDLRICAEAGTVADALQAARQERPDLAVIDLSLPDGNGLELIKRLKADLPELRMLVCSMHDESLFAERAINAGARGYVNKHQVTEQVLDAIRQVLSGRIYLSEKMVERVINGFAKKKDGAASSIEDLSDRELEVFGLIGQGLSTSKIAERLHLSVKTVETHREKIKRKLQLATGGELVRHAVQWHIEQA
jgi:DNA-binding NarL/FixJ family response regulator